jgi:hypothetical protein
MSPTANPVSRRWPLALVLVSAVGLSACTATSTATQAGTAAPASPTEASTPASAPASLAAVASSAPSAAPSESQSGAPSASVEASAAPSASEASAVPTAIDPCQLITGQEASSLTGATFGAGKSSTLSGNAKMCTYGANTKNVFEVIVAIAPDVATAKKAEASAEADLQANASQIQQGMTITKLPNFAPNTDAVLMELKPNSLGISGRSMLLLRGTSFAAFDDLALGGSAPSADAMKAEAMKVLAQLP